ncbi:transposase [Bosea sp. R86505]|uniref:transposase n=1 Tax=Bosea sp. R86505 TaxID=3101710 RepID=UPI00366BF8F9
MPGAVVSAVARRHGLTPQQLFTWRREARKAAEVLPAFVPAVIAQPVAVVSEVGASSRSSRPRRRAQKRHGPSPFKVADDSGVRPLRRTV